MVELRVYDSGPDYQDRYIIVFAYGECLSVSEDLTFSQYSECTEGCHLGEQICFEELPKHIQQHVVDRLSAGEPGGLFESIAELHEWRMSYLTV